MEKSTHTVIRPFKADGKELRPGDKVDASNWINVERLEESKYIRAIRSEKLIEELMQAFMTQKK